jgi:hypothetical protein
MPLSDGLSPADTNHMANKLRSMSALALTCALATGCDALKKTTSPTTPDVSAAAFAGTWVTSRSSLPEAGCGAVTYTVKPVTASSATITFSATCAGTIQINGSGVGNVNGSALDWNAQGTVAQGTLSCPFTITNGKATENPAGVRIIYSGTVCGIPVSGDEVLKKQ